MSRGERGLDGPEHAYIACQLIGLLCGQPTERMLHSIVGGEAALHRAVASCLVLSF